jgi:hypothetical protein
MRNSITAFLAAVCASCGTPTTYISKEQSARELAEERARVQDQETAKEPPRTESQSAVVQDDEPARANWFEGGTLHKATMEQWSRATYANRLATSADFVKRLLKMNRLEPQHLASLRKVAVELEEGISAAGGPLTARKEVTEIAATIWATMERQAGIR